MDTKELEAGRVLDAEVHQKIFGATPLDCFEGVYPENRTNPYPGTDADWIKDSLPHYSTDIAAAWQVVEKLRLTNWVQVIGFNGQQGYPSHNYECWTAKHGETDANAQIGFADTAPLAICRAALKVVWAGLG